MSAHEDITSDLENVPEGWTVEIHPEDSPEDPYKAWDQLSTFWANYRDSTAGQRDTDEFSSLDLEYFDYYDRTEQVWTYRDVSTWGEIRRTVERKSPGAIAFPAEINTYDHTYSMDRSPNDEDDFDHRSTGVVYVTRAQMLKNFVKTGAQRITAKDRAMVADCLNAEIETYSQYASGDVWGYVIKDEDGEDLDSLWGLYGWDYAKEAAQEAVNEHAPDWHAKRKEESEELAFSAAY